MKKTKFTSYNKRRVYKKLKVVDKSSKFPKPIKPIILQNTVSSLMLKISRDRNLLVLQCFTDNSLVSIEWREGQESFVQMLAFYDLCCGK